MGRRPPVLAGVLAGLLAGVGVGTAAATPAAIPAAIPAATPAATPAIREARISEHGSRPSPWRADVAYAVVVGRTAAARRIDATLRGEADAMVAGFVRQLPAGLLPKGTGASTIEATVQTDIVTPDVVGFTERTSTFPAGAAHSVSLVTTDTFDMASGARWHLPGIFRNGDRYLPFLSRESRQLLRRQLGPALDPTTMLDAGTEARLVNFQAWAVTPFGLQLTFSSYQVGPYGVGTPSVLVPFAPLARLTRPGGPLTLAEADRVARTPLLPATGLPAVDECWAAAATNEAFPRPVCAGGRVNVAAWDLYASFDSRLLRLGAAARPATVVAAACADEARLDDPAAVRGAERVAAAYFGWRFLTSPLATFPADCRPRR